MVGEAETRGFADVVLWVLESNARARWFYESLGFRTDGRKRVFLERREGALHEVGYRRSATALSDSDTQGGYSGCRRMDRVPELS